MASPSKSKFTSLGVKDDLFEKKKDKTFYHIIKPKSGGNLYIIKYRI